MTNHRRLARLDSVRPAVLSGTRCSGILMGARRTLLKSFRAIHRIVTLCCVKKPTALLGGKV
jgi:hypothetical protein